MPPISSLFEITYYKRSETNRKELT
jgi:hypothetical protein